MASSAGGLAPRATEVDGIRGWASFSVLVFHLVFVVFGDRFIELRGLPWAYAPFNGPLAVFVFFILSGDALSIGYLRSGDRAVIDSLLLRRYFRLMIPVAMSTALVFGAMRWHFNWNVEAGRIVRLYEWLSDVLAFTPSWDSFLQYVLLDVFSPSFVYSAPPFVYNPMLWTMPVELAGSVLVFSFWYLSPSILRPKPLLAAMTLALGVLGSYYALFFCGMLLSVLRSEGTLAHWRSSKLWPWVATPIAAAAAVFHAQLGEHDPAYRHVGLASAAALVVCFYVNPVALRFFRSRLSRWLGEISFPLYLTQFAVIVSLTSWLIVSQQPIGRRNALWISALSALVALMIATVFRSAEKLALRTVDAQLGRLLVPRNGKSA